MHTGPGRRRRHHQLGPIDFAHDRLADILGQHARIEVDPAPDLAVREARRGPVARDIKLVIAAVRERIVAARRHVVSKHKLELRAGREDERRGVLAGMAGPAQQQLIAAHRLRPQDIRRQPAPEHVRELAAVNREIDVNFFTFGHYTSATSRPFTNVIVRGTPPPSS